MSERKYGGSESRGLEKKRSIYEYDAGIENPSRGELSASLSNL